MKKLIIFGNAEIASLAKYYFENDSEYEVVAFTVDDEYCGEDSFEGLPLVPYSTVSQLYPPCEYEAHVALSYQKLNQLRQDKYHQLKSDGYKLASYVCSKSAIWSDLNVGDNCFILENQTIQPTVKIGNNVMIWSSNHIGHGTEIKDHVYMASNICISGHCVIGERTFIGVAVAMKDFCKIGADCFITMGANIVKDSIEDGSTVLAPQSNYLGSNDRIGKKIKRSYFKL
ncbi:acetyltransferase [Vibrio sp. St2]|uniref:acetyltransferase n=1 Tax=Vibrio sp. St2 TaxID=2853441 RepID=UPI00248EE1D7|nr:acetyltransferase [Vibrio sp. St2]